MRPPVLALLASVSAIGIGLAMIPRPLEHVTMLSRDKQFETALTRADEYVEVGETRAELLMQTFLLNERYGDLGRAKLALRAYLKLRPDDAEGWRKAAWVYANAHRSEPLLEALENVVRLTGDADVAKRLVRLYRLHSQFEDELRVLQGISLDDLGREDGLRLASLLVAENQLAAAANVLVHFAKAVEAGETQTRLLLFDVLLSQERYEEAVGLASNWLVDWGSAAMRADLVRKLLQTGADEAAFALASQADESLEPTVLAYLLDVFSREARLDLFGGLLSSWINHAGNMTDERIQTHLQQVVIIASERGMQALIFEGLVRQLDRHERPDLAASLAEAILDRFGQPALMPYRPALTPGILAARPLLAARLLLAEGNLHAARHYLLQADLEKLGQQLCTHWLPAAQAVLAPDQLLSEIVTRSGTGLMPDCLIRPALELAGRIGRNGEVLTIWANLQRGTALPDGS
ncbi:MAG: hypothetical protein MEQ84_02535 [Mesorhizobium sp.]|nr:hypothetical protein [Mesorhizobium sp.]